MLFGAANRERRFQSDTTESGPPLLWGTSRRGERICWKALYNTSVLRIGSCQSNSRDGSHAHENVSMRPLAVWFLTAVLFKMPQCLSCFAASFPAQSLLMSPV